MFHLINFNSNTHYPSINTQLEISIHYYALFSHYLPLVGKSLTIVPKNKFDIVRATLLVKKNSAVND